METVMITGLPGTGKTTLIENLSRALGASRCQGFYTREIRQGRARTGFEWQTFDGSSGVLADLQKGEPRVGKYRVHLETFDRMLDRYASPAPEKILLIDEIGKMECLSKKFRDLLSEWDKADVSKVFTVAGRGTPFIEAFKSRHNKNLLVITRSNRDQLLTEVVDRLRAHYI